MEGGGEVVGTGAAMSGLIADFSSIAEGKLTLAPVRSGMHWLFRGIRALARGGRISLMGVMGRCVSGLGHVRLGFITSITGHRGRRG